MKTEACLKNILNHVDCSSESNLLFNFIFTRIAQTEITSAKATFFTFGNILKAGLATRRIEKTSSPTSVGTLATCKLGLALTTRNYFLRRLLQTSCNGYSRHQKRQSKIKTWILQLFEFPRAGLNSNFYQLK